MIQQQNIGIEYIFPFFPFKTGFVGKKIFNSYFKLVLNLNPGFKTRLLVHAFGTGFRPESGL